MIITQTPFRITLGGGGTDLPSFYEQHGGFVFTMSINKYMYIFLHRLPIMERKSIIRYSQVEVVDNVEDIKHPLVREALRLHNLRAPVEISSIADMPAKTGLGSSGSYLVGLLTAIRAYKGESVPLVQIAEEACHIEMNVLGEPVGKQDQYIAAFGGFRVLEIARDGHVVVRDVPVDFNMATELVSKARVYYTGIQRSATNVLRGQDEAARKAESVDHSRVMDSLCHIKEIGKKIEKAFLDHDLDAFAILMDEHWRYKQKMSQKISLSVMDVLYEKVKREFGVLGGKIIGAGGGGFIMLYTSHNGRDLDNFMAANDMPRVSYFPSPHGSRVAMDMTCFEDFDTGSCK